MVALVKVCQAERDWWLFKHRVQYSTGVLAFKQTNELSEDTKNNRCQTNTKPRHFGEHYVTSELKLTIFLLSLVIMSLLRVKKAWNTIKTRLTNQVQHNTETKSVHEQTLILCYFIYFYFLLPLPHSCWILHSSLRTWSHNRLLAVQTIRLLK